MEISRILLLPKNRLFEKIVLFVILVASLIGYWYFEPSAILRYFALALSIGGTAWAFFYVTEKPEISSQREFLILFILYLGLFSLYNLLYSLNLPMYLIMMVIFGLVSILFFGLIIIDCADQLMEKNMFNLMIVLMGLVILEIFLSLAFWPVDPKIKSAIIVVIFYLIINLIYLYIHHVLRFKKLIGFLAVSLLILAVLILNA